MIHVSVYTVPNDTTLRKQFKNIPYDNYVIEWVDGQAIGLS